MEEPDVLNWRKPGRSFANGNCAEVGNPRAGGVAVRDSKDRGGPVLRFTPGQWSAFLAGMRAGEARR